MLLCLRTSEQCVNDSSLLCELMQVYSSSFVRSRQFDADAVRDRFFRQIFRTFVKFSSNHKSRDLRA